MKTDADRPGKQVAAGRTADGITILRPAVSPKHFTHRQIEKTVDMVRGKPDRHLARDGSTGKFTAGRSGGSRARPAKRP